MGSRGLGSNLKGGSGKTPTKWEINSKNAKDYGILLKKRRTSKVTKATLENAYANLDASLETVNQMGILLGMRPDELPKVLMNYGGYNGAANAGSTNIADIFGNQSDIIDKNTGEIIFSPHATINLYIPGLKSDEVTTAAHEMYHAMEAMWILKDFSGWKERSNAWFDNMYSQAICHRALLSMGKQKDIISIDDKVWKEQAKTIYINSWEKAHPDRTYASSEGRGKYAETVTCTIEAALRYGEKNISPYGQAILKELRKEIKAHRKKGGKR